MEGGEGDQALSPSAKIRFGGALGCVVAGEAFSPVLHEVQLSLALRRVCEAFLSQLGFLHSPVKRYLAHSSSLVLNMGFWDVPKVELLLLDDDVEHLVGALEFGDIVLGVLGPFVGGFVGIATPAPSAALSP